MLALCDTQFCVIFKRCMAKEGISRNRIEFTLLNQPYFANINLKIGCPSSFLHTSFELVFIILYFLNITETSTTTLDTLLNIVILKGKVVSYKNNKE